MTTFTVANTPTAKVPNEATINAPILLNDAQVSRFITDGYLLLDSGVAEEIHRGIYARLQQVLHEEGNPGNNILPAVPEMQRVLDSPTVRGALESVLGPNYLLHPHRFAHNNEPGKKTAEGAKVGEGSRTFVGWHQDDHSPLSRPRHHYPRYAMLLYYPQDTPVEMGPTQIIPATHLHRSLTDADKERGFQASGKAGTCVLVHFDLAHGGSLNLADRTRHMVKFVFVRTEEPEQPSWKCRRNEWETPAAHQSPYASDVVWSHQWNWMAGKGNENTDSLPANTPPASEALAEVMRLAAIVQHGTSAQERIAAINRLAAFGEQAAPAVSVLISAMQDEEAVHQNAIYALAAIGEPAVGPLIEELKQRETNGWSEGATVMENSAYALAAIGKAAVSALLSLLDSENEWVRINAQFALGEMGAAAGEAQYALIASLADPSHAVVRTALDALGQVGAEEGNAIPALRKLLLDSSPDWQTPIRREWTGQDQVRTNAMMALLRLGWKSEATTQLLAACLNDTCGYVTGLALECLLRQNTLASLNAALPALCARRWDETLRQGGRTF